MAQRTIPGFQLARHVQALDRKLTALIQRQITRLIIEMPPRHSKSTTASRVLPAYYHGLNPTHNLMFFTATDAMAQRAGRAARALAVDWLPRLFHQRLDPKYGAWSHWKIDSTPIDAGECFFSSVGGGRTMGAGAHLIGVDDYFRNAADALSETKRKSQEEWFLTSALTRLTPDGVVLLMATRWHQDDLIGVAERAQEITGDTWEVLNLPAIAEENDALGRQPGEALWPEQWPVDKLQRVQARFASRGYPWMWEALYQQKPPDITDSEWPAHYFDDHIWYDEPPELLAKVTALDPSLGQTDKSDFAAFATAGIAPDGVVYADALVERMDVATIASRGAEYLRMERPDEFLTETNQFQALLVTPFEEACRRVGVEVPVLGVTNTKDKRVRIRRLSPLLAAGRLRFRRGSPGSALTVEQLRGFPSHKHDDAPDALEMAIRRLDDLVTGGVPGFHRTEPDAV